MNSSNVRLSIESFLDTIDVELSGYCNAHCVFCPREKMTREKAILSPHIFEALLQEISAIRPNGPERIIFCGFGEPLLNPNLCSFAERVNQMFPDTVVVVVSNGSELNKETCDAILSGGINAFSCSMQTIHKDKFDATMRGPSFESTIRWITYLAERKLETGLHVNVTYIRTSQTDSEVDEYRQFWNNLGVDIIEQPLINRGGFLSVYGDHEARNRERCSLFNSRLFVAANGDILACCQDLNSQSRFGAIGIDSLYSMLMKRFIVRNEKRLFPMCAICNDENAGPLKDDLEYSSSLERVMNNPDVLSAMSPQSTERMQVKDEIPSNDSLTGNIMTNTNKETLKLDIACGKNKKPGFTGVDIWEGADIICDLEKFPWPFEDDSVDEIFCSHYIEHTPDLISFANEIYRILKVGANAEIIAPYYSSIRAWQDPTHLRAISEATFYYFIKEWRLINQLDHYPITADFEFTYRYILHQTWHNKDDDELQFAIRHYINVVNDIHVTLTKKKETDDYVSRLMNHATMCWDDSNFERAQMLCKSILLIEKNLDASLMLGEFEMKNENYDNAVEYFSDAIEIDPASFEAHVGLVRALAGKGQTDAAKNHIDVVGKKDPDLASLLESLI